MTDAHEAVQSLSPEEAFEIFKALFKNASFMDTAIPFKNENQEYTVFTGRRVGNTPQTETANFAVVFLDESNKHFGELRRKLIEIEPCVVMGIKEGDLNKLSLPEGCKKLITITKDGETWHLYQSSDQRPLPQLLLQNQMQFIKGFFLLTPEGLRKTIATQIDRAQRDLGSLRETMSVENVDTVQDCLKQLAELPDDLLTEDLQALRAVLSSDPDYLNRLKEILQDAQNLISPAALEAASANIAAQGGREGAGS